MAYFEALQRGEIPMDPSEMKRSSSDGQVEDGLFGMQAGSEFSKDEKFIIDSPEVVETSET
jgi:hypothetical protein